MTGKQVALVVAALVTLTCIGIRGTLGLGKTAFKAEAVRVQAVVFSGLPNPTWSLQLPQVYEFLEKVSKLPASEEKARQGGLGYSGFRLELIQADGSIVALHVYDGVMWLEDNASNTYADNERTLERWLITTAPLDVQKNIPQ